LTGQASNAQHAPFGTELPFHGSLRTTETRRDCFAEPAGRRDQAPELTSADATGAFTTRRVVVFDQAGGATASASFDGHIILKD
jgi:hypothetical protein